VKASTTRRLGARVVVPVALAIVIFVAGIVSELAPQAIGEVVGSIAMVVGFGTAGILMYRRSKALPDIERRPWQVMAFSLMLAATGLVVFATMLPGDPPVFGPVDVLFLTVYAVLIVALAMLAKMHTDGPPWGLTLLDMGVAIVAATAIVWELVLADITAVQASTWERVGLSLYPILDVGIIVGLCLVALRRSHFRFDLRLLLVAGAMSSQVLADLLYLRDGITAANFTDAQPHFGLFATTAALVLIAATVIDRPAARKEFPDRDTPLWAIMWPYLLAGALVPIHILRVNGLLDEVATTGVVPRDTTGERVVLYALLLVGVLVVFRQLAAIKYNRSRVEQQRRELISSVSHELRTPLTAVVGFLHVLDEDPDGFSASERDSMMSEVSSQAKHMSRTVTDLITLARDGGANLMIRSSEASLADIVESASSEAHGTSFTSDVDDHVLHVDSGRLDQAIGHLLSNARKYGGERIHLRAAVQGGTLTIEVHDDGPGIPTKYLSSIWNQFDRGERRLDSTNPGLGIGLAIVRAVAAAHGGSADYRRSELLGGSCFSITMPANTRSGAPWIRELTAR
jgi:signal transduction histidine kinase